MAYSAPSSTFTTNDTASRAPSGQQGGGSAPKYTGQNIINPLASICAGAMMLETLGEREAALAVENAVKEITATKIKSLSAGKMGYATSEIGDMVAQRV